MWSGCEWQFLCKVREICANRENREERGVDYRLKEDVGDPWMCMWGGLVAEYSSWCTIGTYHFVILSVHKTLKLRQTGNEESGAIEIYLSR